MAWLNATRMATPMTLLDFDAATATIIVGLAGGYDAANKRAILDQVASVLSLHGVDEVALDMSRVTFIDSAALGAMVAARRICESQGKRLTVRNPSIPVTRILRITFADVLFA